MTIRRIILTLICMALLSAGAVAGAVDLPIDIELITQEAGTGEAHTAGRNVEVLTPSAGEISRAINEHFTQRRDMKLTDLFTEYGSGLLSKYEQITSAAYSFALFAEPANFSGMRAAAEEEFMPTWLIVIIFVFSAVGGFVLAAILKQRKRGTNVH
ncbi:MAG: hypothetical protein FWC20_05390 [Oscillospiraceae bacterium]|nr:hypothetical protein [Oscillospiraceae bacterium]MCL2278826.1 hypothetical protein [Oscillospiraceae bacterium]